MINEIDDGWEQARAEMENISALVTALNLDWDRLMELEENRVAFGDKFPIDALEELRDLKKMAGDYRSLKDVEEAVQENIFCLEVRSGWTLVGQVLQVEKFKILLCCGGPTVWIEGDIGLLGRVNNPVLWYFSDEYREAREYFGMAHNKEDLENFCQQFYFGV